MKFIWIRIARTKGNMRLDNEIKNPFYPDTRKGWLDSLLANQFTMTEIRDGTAWRHVKDIPGERIDMGDYFMPSGMEIYMDHNRKNKR